MTTRLTREEILLLQQIATSIVDTVREAGLLGAPAGPLYAAMMAFGCTLDQFQQIKAGLVGAGMLRKTGDLYFVAGGGK